MKPLISNATSCRPRPFISRVIGDRGSDIPSDFVELSDFIPSSSARQFGYFGEGRFVAFRYEPRAEDVIWRDERSFGIGTGAWQVFLDHVQPLADLYDVNVGSNGSSARHMLVFDRVRHSSYFAPRESAEAFLTRRRALLPETAQPQRLHVR